MNCRIPLEQIRPGDILVFKGSGPLFAVLSRILKVFELKWDRWGWHVGFVASEDKLCESIAEGIVLSPLNKYPPEETRAYRWFDVQPERTKIVIYVTDHLGKKYDVAIYFWTMMQYLFRHFWNRRIPRLLDDRYTCWENVFQFCECMGKQIGAEYDCPMLPDMLKAFGE